MNIVFMGTPDFAAASLESLVKAGHHIPAVITQPDKPKGRGKEVQFTPVKETAIRHEIPVYQPLQVKEKEFAALLKSFHPDVVVVAAFGQLLSKEILEIPKYGCINVHASLLPRYRGAAPIQLALIDGEPVTGVTTMYMEEGLDTGDMLDKIEIPIEKGDTGGTLHDKLARAGAQLILETLDKLEKGTAVRIRQADKDSSYAGMIDKKMGSMDFSMSAVELERLIRGLNPWPSAYTKVNGKMLKIWEAEVMEKDYPGNYGEITEITNKYIIVKTGKGALGITRLQLEGKKKMETPDFLRGYPLKTGEMLG